jgi:hypothetical protein
MTSNRSAIPAPQPRNPEAAFRTKQSYPAVPVPTLFEDDLPGADQLGLTIEEIEHFRKTGYLIKRGLIPSATFAPFLDLWWQQPPIHAAKMSPDDPATWISPGRFWPKDNRWSTARNWMGQGAWPSPEEDRPGANVGDPVGRLPHKLTHTANDVWRWHGIGHDPEFVDATTAHPNVLYMAEALLGGPIKRPRRNRGIYSIFPHGGTGEAESKLGPHMDESMTDLQVVTYLDDVTPGSGGFTAYPTSPQRLYPTSVQALNWVETEKSREVLHDILSEVQPIEFTGKAGDVMFCHSLVLHSAGIHDGDRVRLAAIQDINRSRERGHMRWIAAGKHGGEKVYSDMDGVFRFPLDTGDDPADGDREVLNQWTMDSNEFVLARHVPLEDMFEDWNLGQRPVTGNIIDEIPWWEKYKLPILPTGDVPRGGGGTPAVPLSDIANYEGEGVWRVK